MSTTPDTQPTVWILAGEFTDEAERVYRVFPTREAAVAAIDAWAADPDENLQCKYDEFLGCFLLDPDGHWEDPMWEVAVFQVQIES